LIVTVQALALFWKGELVPMSGDAPEYHRIAVNLLQHHGYSASKAPPYEPTTYKTPGYPFFLAFAYALSGQSLLFVRCVQFLLLVATAGAVYHLALRFTTRKIALTAALLCAIYQPFVFSATLRTSETLSIFLVSVLGLEVARVSEAPRRWLEYLALGALAGFATLVRPSLVLLVLMPVFAVARMHGWSKRGLRHCALLLAGYLLLISPLVMRNVAISRSFIPLGSGSGMSLHASMQQYSGEMSYKITISEWEEWIADYERRQQRGEKFAAERPRQDVPRNVQVELYIDQSYKSDARLLARGITARHLLRTLPLRIAYFWGVADPSPWYAGFYHRTAQIAHVLLSLLIIVGIVAKRRSLRSQWILWVVPLYLMFIHLVFHVEGRYSFPARPFLLLYAAIGLWQCIRVLLPRQPGPSEAQPSTPAPGDHALVGRL
jgi:4-amino-4-deoxy-L-arabinose transferase-like glycosyltransferase